MADPDELDEINRRIAILRDNLRRLVEQGAAYAGAADEARISERIADMESRLEELVKQRDELSKQGESWFEKSPVSDCGAFCPLHRLEPGETFEAYDRLSPARAQCALEDKPMPSKIVSMIGALALAAGAAPSATAAAMHHHAAQHGKYRYYSHPKGAACKGEFMYMKGGKCMDARNKPAAA